MDYKERPNSIDVESSIVCALQVTDEQLVVILGRITEEVEGAVAKKGVVIQRRKYGFDDDDDDDDDSDLL